jgi:ABC-type uncharacterized transport system ATPase subunit
LIAGKAAEIDILTGKVPTQHDSSFIQDMLALLICQLGNLAAALSQNNLALAGVIYGVVAKDNVAVAQRFDGPRARAGASIQWQSCQRFCKQPTEFVCQLKPHSLLEAGRTATMEISMQISMEINLLVCWFPWKSP